MILEKDKQILYKIKYNIERNLNNNKDHNRKYLLNLIEKTFDCKNQSLKIKVLDLISKYFHCEDGKFPAPPWLAYPTYTKYTMGWRMGYGEQYNYNFKAALRNKPEFDKYFQQPKIWEMIEFGDFSSEIEKFKKLPLFWLPWNNDINKEYDLRNLKKDYPTKGDVWSKVQSSNNLIIIKEDLINKKFKIYKDALMFNSIKHAVYCSKASYFYENINLDSSYQDLESLHLKFSRKQNKIWNKLKYFIYLNVIYYCAMSNKSFKRRLLNTGNKILAYSPPKKKRILGVNFHDGKSVGYNLFGFALMEVRNELRRLYKNNNYIDWEYTDFIRDCDFYTFNPYKNNFSKLKLTNRKSQDYKIYEATYKNLKYLVKDVDLSPKIKDKYVKGKILDGKVLQMQFLKLGK